MDKATFNSVVEGMAALHAKKNADYGDSFHESWEAYENKGYPPMACYALGRIRDKYKRIENLVLSKNEPNFESIEDNLADLAAYCIMSLVELKNSRKDV